MIVQSRMKSQLINPKRRRIRKIRRRRMLNQLRKMQLKNLTRMKTNNLSNLKEEKVMKMIVMKTDGNNPVR